MKGKIEGLDDRIRKHIIWDTTGLFNDMLQHTEPIHHVEPLPFIVAHDSAEESIRLIQNSIAMKRIGYVSHSSALLSAMSLISEKFPQGKDITFIDETNIKDFPARPKINIENYICEPTATYSSKPTPKHSNSKWVNFEKEKKKKKAAKKARKANRK